MDSIYSSDFWVALGTVGLFFATLALAFVGWTQISNLRMQNAEQIENQRLENVKWQTIKACNRYDIDPIIHECLIKTFQHSNNKEIIVDKKLLKVYVTTILNYLDPIAIGLAQGLYDESIIRDHMQPIFKKHVNQYLKTSDIAASYGLEIDNFSHVVDLDKRWREVKTTYSSQPRKEHNHA